MFVIGCTSKAPKDFNLNQLTRVDIEVVKADESYEEAIMITDEETVDELRKIFKQIKWEPNVEPKMAKKKIYRQPYFSTINGICLKDHLNTRLVQSKQ